MRQFSIGALNVEGGKRRARSFAACLKNAVSAQRIDVEMVFDMNVTKWANFHRLIAMQMQKLQEGNKKKCARQSWSRKHPL